MNADLAAASNRALNRIFCLVTTLVRGAVEACRRCASVFSRPFKLPANFMPLPYAEMDCGWGQSKISFIQT